MLRSYPASRRIIAQLGWVFEQDIPRSPLAAAVAAMEAASAWPLSKFQRLPSLLDAIGMRFVFGYSPSKFL